MCGSQIVTSRHLRLVKPPKRILVMKASITTQQTHHSLMLEPTKKHPQSSEMHRFFLHLQICCQLKLVRAFGVCWQTFPTPHKQKNLQPHFEKKQNHSCVLREKVINPSTKQPLKTLPLKTFHGSHPTSHPIPQEPAFPAFPQLLRGHTLQGVGQVKESQPRMGMATWEARAGWLVGWLVGWLGGEESMGASGHNK